MSQASAEYVAAATRQFDEAMNRVGFRTSRCGNRNDDWEWSGRVGPAHEPATITLDHDFPFSVPIVTLSDRQGTADWHQTVDGVLCLWDSHSKGDQPWLDGEQLRARIEEWIASAGAGWPDDSPQLDLEAYNRPRVLRRDGRVILPVLVVEEWSEVAGGWFRATLPGATGLITLRSVGLPAPPIPHGPGVRKRRRRRKKARTEPVVHGVAVDLGEMSVPLVSSDDLIAALGPHRDAVTHLLRAGQPVLIAARYSRSNAHGLLGFWVEKNGGREVRECLRVVERGPSQSRRAGWHAATIADRRVSVIGAGSVGSYLADLLHRSGIRDLCVHDSDVLLPGNLVRHAASPAFVGAPKTTAVRETAALRDHMTLIDARGPVRGLEAAVTLLNDRDLVVDCSGDRLTWQVLLAAAHIVGVSFLHVAVIGHGQFGRVDVCPPLDGSTALPEDRSARLVGEREGGCGDPVSPTPPAAVVETAAMGARLAIRMLAGEPVAPAGESRELFPVAP